MNTHTEAPVPHRSSVLRGLSYTCLNLVLVSFTGAQQAPSQTPPPAGDASREKAIELSPFLVNSDQDVGYLAGNTLAGSRFNTALKDTPASISVMTSEFLADIGAFRIEEALEYAVNVEFFQDDDRTAVNGNANYFDYQTYRVRGLPASISRNYFPWGTEAALPDETAFLDRIEDSRGPNSVLFGIGSPGGVINSNTKQPLLGRAFQKGSFTLGSFDSKRAALDINQPVLGGKLAFRVNLVYNKNNTFRHFEFQEHQRALLSGLYKLTDRTRLRIEFERGQLADNKSRTFNLRNQFMEWDRNGRPTVAAPIAQNAALGISRYNVNDRRLTYINNNGAVIEMRGTNRAGGFTVPGELAPDGRPIAGGVIIDRSISDYSINVGGPAQTRYSRYGIFSTFLEHQIAKNTFLELAYNHRDLSKDTRNPGGSAFNLDGDPNERYAGTPNSFARQVFLETSWNLRITHWTRSDVGRATLSHELNAGKWGNYRFAALGQYDKSFSLIHTVGEMWIDPGTGLTPFHPTPDNALNRVWRRSYPIEGNWGTYFVDGPRKNGGLLSNVTDPVTGRALASAWLPSGAPQEMYWTQKAGMVVMQGKWFKERLVAAAGLRRDEITEYRLRDTRNPLTGRRVLLREFNEGLTNHHVGRTKTLGLVYHVTPAISLIYNRADNVALPGRGRRTLPPSGEPGENIGVPKPEGQGEDIGVGLSLFDGKIYAKAVAYTTSMVGDSTTAPSARTNNERIMDALLARADVTQADRDSRAGHAAHGSHGLFDFDSKGYEIQVTANPTKNWRFVVNYAKAEAVQSNTFATWVKWLALTENYLAKFDKNIVTSRGLTIAEEIEEMRENMRVLTSSDGIGKLGNRHHKVSLFTRYNFSSEWLKGAYIGGGYKYQSKMFVGRDPAGDKLWGNSYWRADALAGYTLHGLRKGRKLSFQLNVANIFNEREPLITRFQNNGSVDFHVVQAPATWRFTTNFEY